MKTTSIFLAGLAILATTAAIAPRAAACPGQHRSQAPEFAQRRVQTLAMERNRTVAIEGLLSDPENEDKVPALSDVPTVAKLFKNNETRKKKRNLLVLVTPKLVKAGEDGH